MRCVVQRVRQAQVSVAGKLVGQIQQGLLIYVGLGQKDAPDDLTWMLQKIIGLRIFSDSEDKMNLSVQDIHGELLLVSQFTLFGDCRKGKRPSFSSALTPQLAASMFQQFVDLAKNLGLPVATGRFAADMQVQSINDGPVTLLLDSKKLF